MNLFLINLFQLSFYYFYGNYYLKKRNNSLLLMIPILMMLTIFGIQLHIEAYLLYVLPTFWLCSYIDLECGEIPDLCHINLLLCALLFHQLHWKIFLVSFLIGFFLSFFHWMGFGDTKLISLWSLIIGKRIIYGYLGGCYIGLFFYLIQKKKESMIPFAPSLCISFILVELFFTYW